MFPGNIRDHFYDIEIHDIFLNKVNNALEEKYSNSLKLNCFI